MRFVILLLIVFSFSFTGLAQDEINYCQQAKIQQYTSLMKANQINYPGDSRYDVTYYKLDLTVTYTPQNITGAVTVNATVQSNNVSSAFLDLTDSLVVDSVKLNGLITSFTHADDILNVNLNSNYNSGD